MVNILIRGQILTFPERKPGIPMQRYQSGDDTDPNYITARKAIENAFPEYKSFKPTQQVGAFLWPEKIRNELSKYCLQEAASEQAARRLHNKENGSGRTSTSPQRFSQMDFEPGGPLGDATQTGRFGTGPS